MQSGTISQLLDTPVQVLDCRPLGGGCISDVRVCHLGFDSEPARLNTLSGESLRLPDPANVVVKRNTADQLSNFRCEANGLLALAATQTIRVPKPIAVGTVDGDAYLVMEWIDGKTGRATAGDFQLFGQRLAEMHHASQGSDHGWDEDNFLGSAKQINTPEINGAPSTWEEFFAEQRLRRQLRWCQDQGLAEHHLVQSCETIIERIADLLSGREAIDSLLHGDLWSGNYLFDQSSQPVVIDPAVYRGCREAEWGMIAWFGSCPPEFEAGYQASWPMPDGWQRRVEIYKLYHQLNHLNLFGASYHGACLATADRVLRQS
ncbi:fructosamine kinase family protein [Rhodopirellula sp. MGV]|uniref:fructosamine kinase family protein n=1 Tax=Rhodopirellula sp. MGV TaxID=2023130 RepID=UPI000B971A76|nr:fructosamine kinase family protein [Rhodopirellula sp. MGV]OYP29955.1 hypothetical protein CGZ80_23310 [Rhodopirellula sp. MGV]PNY33411.1 fructosamine kinase [Rhodopirellula baltica]